jgi:hypothetical protein
MLNKDFLLFPAAAAPARKEAETRIDTKGFIVPGAMSITGIVVRSWVCVYAGDELLSEAGG